MSVVKAGKHTWENKGKTGETHGTFHTKAAAEAQKAAIYASGWKNPHLGKHMAEKHALHTRHERESLEMHERHERELADLHDRHKEEQE
jgi:hypothetical protein